jgi:hypothetical protein
VTDQTLTKVVSRVRRDLAAIPDLANQLPDLPVRGQGGGDGDIKRSPASPSRPPLDLQLLELRQGRELDNWVMLAVDEMLEAGIDTPEDTPPANRGPSIAANCAWLAQHAEWIIEHNPDVPDLTNRKTGKTIPAFTGFPTAIRQLHWQYRRAAGDLPGPRISCPECGNRAFIDGAWMFCTEVEEHARSIKEIEQGHRLAPAETTAEVCDRFGIDDDRLFQWKKRGKIRPARKDGRKLYWWPWDVFCQLNPTVAEAIEARDTASA